MPMLSPHLRKFTALYETFGLGAVKNVCLLAGLLPLCSTVNLYKIKDYVGGFLDNKNTRPMSHYKRLTRFFDELGGNEEFLHAMMAVNLRLLWGLGSKVLVMDGTSWKIGGTKIHYLMLSVLVGKVAVPLYWEQLGKIGASSQAERQSLFEKAMRLFDLAGMTLLADREYVGKDWFKFLVDSRIDFVIRLKWADYYKEVDAVADGDYEAMYQKCIRKRKLVKRRITLAGKDYWLLMLPNPKANAGEDIFVLLTTLPPTPKTAQLYARRWKIECLFRHMKSNGFNLEDLNLKDTGKNLLLMGILAISYTLAVRIGWKRRNVIPSKKYADGSAAPAVSLFRDGLSWLTQKCFRLIDFLIYLSEVLCAKNHAISKNVQ